MTSFDQPSGGKQGFPSPLEFVIAKWEHDCCGHAFLRVEDRCGGRTAPTRDQCDCRCHEKDVKEARRQLLNSAPKLYAASDEAGKALAVAVAFLAGVLDRARIKHESDPTFVKIRDAMHAVEAALAEARGETGGAA